MPAFVPPLPVSGERISSEWGIDLHRRVYSALGCVASGNQLTGITGSAESKLPIDNHVGGYNMVDSANDILKIPVGGSGLYLMIAACRVLNLASGNFQRFRFTKNGSVQVDGISVPGLGGGSSWGTLVGMYTMNDNDEIGVNVIAAAVPGDATLQRFVILRLGNTFGNIVDPALSEFDVPIVEEPIA